MLDPILSKLLADRICNQPIDPGRERRMFRARILALLAYPAEEKPMHAGMSEFVAEQMKGLTEMVTELRRSRVAGARLRSSRRHESSR
jgi:hypothetical protein